MLADGVGARAEEGEGAPLITLSKDGIILTTSLGPLFPAEVEAEIEGDADKTAVDWSCVGSDDATPGSVIAAIRNIERNRKC